MFKVVKDIISSVSIDPSSNTDLSSSDPDSADSELSTVFDSSMNLSASTTDSVGRKSDSKSETDRKADLRLKLVESQVDEYLSKFLEGVVKRFYHGEPFNEYSKVRNYNFGNSKLELYSKYRPNSNLKEFIVQGIIDVPYENLLTLVMELSNRVYWDETYLEHIMMKVDEETKTDFIYSVSKYPFPLTKRTYVVTRTCYTYGEDCLAVLSAATNKMKAPKKIRWSTPVDEFESILVLKNCEPEEVDGVKKITKSRMLVTYFENPKVLLPTSYLNYLIGQLVPGILSKMVKASKRFTYEESVEYVKTMMLKPIPF